MEGEIGRFRRTHLVPVPEVALAWRSSTTLIAAGDVADDARVITGRPITVGAAFAAELPALAPLPGEPFDPARLLSARVDNRARVIGAAVLLLGAGPLSPGAGCWCGCPRPPSRSSTAPRVVARHERAVGRYVAGAGAGSLPGGPCRSSPARCPGRPRWPRPRRAGCSPRPTRPTGTPPAAPAVTGRHPGVDRGPARPPHPARGSADARRWARPWLRARSTRRW